MSWEATAFVNNLRSGVTRSEKFLLMILSNYHNTEKRAAWPSLSTISRDSLLSVRQVSRMVNRLQAKNILSITPDGARGQNIYRFVGLDVEPTIDKMSIVPPAATIDILPPTIDILSTTIDISEPTIDIAMSTNPTIEPIIEPITEPIASAKRAARRNGSSRTVTGDKWTRPWCDVFSDAYTLTKGVPYTAKRGDFVQLAVLCKNEWLTPEKFTQATQNYFSSDLGTHTLADLCVRFGDFYRSPLDRYKVPIKPPESVNNAPTHRETEGERKRREVRESIAADFAAAGDHQTASRVLKGDSWTLDDRRGGVEPDGKFLGAGSAGRSD